MNPNAFSGSSSDASSEFASLYGFSPSAPSIESLYGTGFSEVPVTAPMEPLGVHTDAPMSVNAHIVPTALETSEGFASFFQWAQREAGMPGLHAYAAADPRPEALADIETPWYYFQPGWAEQQQATAAMEASNQGNTLVQRGVFTLLAAAEWPLSIGEAGTRTMLNVPANINMTTQWLTAASLTNDSDNRLTYISNGLGSFGETLFGMAGIGGLAESAASDTLLGSNLGLSRQGVTLSGNAGNYTLRSPIYFDLAPGRLNSGIPVELQNPLVPDTTGESGPSVVLDLFGGKTSQVPGAVNVDVIAQDGVRASALQLPFRDASAGQVIASNPYIPGGSGMMDYLPEASRVLQQDGQLIINSTARNPFGTLPDAQTLQDLGFTVVQDRGPLLPQFQNNVYRFTDGNPFPPNSMRTTILQKTGGN